MHIKWVKNNLLLLQLLVCFVFCFFTDWHFMDLDHILFPFSFTRCGSTHVLRSSLTLILHLKTFQDQQEWKWCLRPWSGVYKISLVWKCVTTVTILHKYKFKFHVSSLQRNDGWGRKSVCGLLPPSWRNTSQAQERLWWVYGLHAWGFVSIIKKKNLSIFAAFMNYLVILLIYLF